MPNMKLTPNKYNWNYDNKHTQGTKQTIMMMMKIILIWHLSLNNRSQYLSQRFLSKRKIVGPDP